MLRIRRIESTYFEKPWQSLSLGQNKAIKVPESKSLAPEVTKVKERTRDKGRGRSYPFSNKTITILKQ